MTRRSSSGRIARKGLELDLDILREWVESGTTVALRAMGCTAQDQPTDDVLDAEAVELQVHDTVEGEGDDGVPSCAIVPSSFA